MRRAMALEGLGSIASAAKAAAKAASLDRCCMAVRMSWILLRFCIFLNVEYRETYQHTELTHWWPTVYETHDTSLSHGCMCTYRQTVPMGTTRSSP